MKAPITLSKFGSFALAAALFVLAYSMLGHMFETLHSPRTFKQIIVFFVLHLSLSVVFHIFISRRKKSSAPPEAE